MVETSWEFQSLGWYYCYGDVLDWRRCRRDTFGFGVLYEGHFKFSSLSTAQYSVPIRKCRRWSMRRSVDATAGHGVEPRSGDFIPFRAMDKFRIVASVPSGGRRGLWKNNLGQSVGDDE